MTISYRRPVVRAAKTIAFVVSVLLLLSSCDIAELHFSAHDAVATVQIGILGEDREETRSSVGSGCAVTGFENAMNNMTLFQFTEDGTLVEAYYFPSLNGKLSVQGRSGITYEFKAVMNMGDVSSWLGKGDSMGMLEQMVYEYGSLPDAMSGCPMSCREASMTMEAKGSVLHLVFTRLMSRFDLKLDCSRIAHGRFEISSLRLYHAPLCVRPLAQSSAAMSNDEVTDGDYATANDVSSLRRGDVVPFYVLENAQGTLLRGNTDPWSKVPSSIGGSAEICTYIELKGIYTDNTGNMRAEHTYRMYLGENSTTNFDVIRGAHHDMTLILSDDGFLKATWKAERHILSDNRTFRFNPDQYSVRYGENQTVTLSGNSGCSFVLSGNLRGAGVLFDPSTMSLSQTMKLDADITGTLTATSWDRILTATCTVTALRYRPDYTLWCVYDYQWDYDEDQTGEVTENTLTEWLWFEAVTSDGQKLPCRFRISGVPACAEYAEKVELVTTGINRGPGPADMPDRELVPEPLRSYTLYVIVDGEESCPSWDSVRIQRR